MLPPPNVLPFGLAYVNWLFCSLKINTYTVLKKKSKQNKASDVVRKHPMGYLCMLSSLYQVGGSCTHLKWDRVNVLTFYNL